LSNENVGGREGEGEGRGGGEMEERMRKKEGVRRIGY
jgi:hypothetical protein